MFGMFNGVVLSNLQVVNLSSTRNLAILGTSILFGLMIPYWVETNPDAINTGMCFLLRLKYLSSSKLVLYKQKGFVLTKTYG